MKRTFVRNLVTSITLLAIMAVTALSIVFVAQAKENQRIALTGQIVPLVSKAHLIGSAQGQQELNLSVGLQPRNQAELNALLSNQSDPHSPLYHRYLTPQQFADEFGPTAQQQQQVVDYLHQQGFSVTNVAPNGLLIDARGTVAQAQAAFQVAINTYQSGTRSFYANASPPTIPASVSSLIVSIGGLDNSVQMRPLYQLAGHKPKPRQLGKRSSLAPRATQSGYGPTELTGAYDSTPLQQAGIQGNNQTVAVFELDGYQSSDITQYLQNYSLGSPSISNVLVDGFNGAAGAGAIEVDLDIEVVAAMAPKATQIVYEGPNSTQGVNDTYNKIVTDNKAQITTISWGECESATGNAELQTRDNIFKQGAAQGITMFAAAGDSGAYDCNDTNLAVDSPAGDPYITGVGGTNLQLNGSAYSSESVWSNASDTQRSPQGSGGGGGISSLFTQPSWQTGPGVKNQYSNGNREVPDVSADADPATGYAVYCTVSAAGCQSSGWITVGGTSAAAPLWAGSTATINEYLQKQGKSGVGFISPTLYSLANSQQQFSPFHDVTSGTNLFYPATAGYDEASGIGSPDIYNIARDIASGTTPPPTPSPTGTAPAPTPSPTATSTPSPGPTPSPTDTPTPPPNPSPTPPSPPTGSLIQNGGFENGSDPWVESSAGGYELVDTTNPHSGNYSAYLCGYSGCDDNISQSFTVPDNASSISVSYWWDGETSSTSSSCDDTFTVTLVDSSGAVIGSLQQACNTDATQSWQQASVDVTQMLASYAGQTVTLVFSSQTGQTDTTTAFFVDDVAVNAA